jgi:hypothetical protein
MGTGRVRIIKRGTASNINLPQSAPVPREKHEKDPMAELICNISGWVAEFKERRRPDPRITFQALFKEVWTSVSEKTLSQGTGPGRVVIGTTEDPIRS